MSGKITFLLLAGLGVVVFLGIRSYGAQMLKMGDVRRADVNEQEFLLTGEKQRMSLTSTAFKSGESIPIEYTCDGADINPRLEVNNIPPGTKSLVLIFDDPDAAGGTWNHWLVWNIPSDIRTIGLRSVPKGANVGVNDFGEFGYSGPCPPSGEHRYMFRIYALDKNLVLASSANRSELESAMDDHIIDKTGLMGRYKKAN
jgi:Raf kinase inhibitor-like YbhB/YbcL family protein